MDILHRNARDIVVAHRHFDILPTQTFTIISVQWVATGGQCGVLHFAVGKQALIDGILDTCDVEYRGVRPVLRGERRSAWCDRQAVPPADELPEVDPVRRGRDHNII